MEPLVAALADQTWTDEVLAQIGTAAVPRVSEELDSENAKVRWRALGVLLRLFAENDSRRNRQTGRRGHDPPPHRGPHPGHLRRRP